MLTVTEAKFTKDKMFRRAIDELDPKLARHIWSVAKRARAICVDPTTIYKMFDLAYDVAYDEPNLPARVACCDVASWVISTGVFYPNTHEALYGVHKPS